ncbi:dTDP-4-dehydrorhamnose 3,5-epimerase family protein [Prescottella equi]|uniref:dTDP-4-dehydrorhamnose 3,5-epimerase family protein n=1 Tax=Rhodococcus hoagii TaxID=43767 RepID=UPI000A0F77CF|nr:dTDP-4-dehydrorhamnose 3,5-epimerase [Prescottella equi]ORJ98548.1 dTDP-4-dehydrorhamnose 3,5-epimerase [Prescottella equi]
MDYRELKIPGAYEVTPRQFGDDRGLFLEWFKQSSFTDATGRPLSVAQANCSVSARGVLRGIHYADVPPGQAKYITCLTGAVLDVVVDLRVGSQTFGQWDSVLLDTEHRRAVFLSEGLGHGFVALEEGSTVVYLCSTEYNPEREHEIDPFDAEVGIDWPTVGTDGSALTFELSAKDQAAPGLASARDAGALPTYHV